MSGIRSTPKPKLLMNRPTLCSWIIRSRKIRMPPPPEYSSSRDRPVSAFWLNGFDGGKGFEGGSRPSMET